MSTANIIMRRWAFNAPWYYVTFSCRDGSARTYRFDAVSGVQIEAGADPKNFRGIWIDGGEEAVGAIEEIAKIAEIAGELL